MSIPGYSFLGFPVHTCCCVAPPPLAQQTQTFSGPLAKGGGGLLDVALRNPPPCFSETDSCFGHQNGPLGASKYQVFLRFYKVLGDLASQNSLNLSRISSFPKVL